MKSEPFKYSWDELVRDGRTYWDGVRNYEARNNLASMKRGDLSLYYHSNEGKEVVGIAEIVRFAARPWRTHMNNLEHEIIYREPSGAVRSQVTTRTYPIIALLEVDQPGYNNRSAYRVLVSRDGIEEIKPLDEPN